MCKITRKLESILDLNNADDKKIMLLAQLIEDMRTDLQNSITSIRKDVEELDSKVSDIIKVKERCPMMNDTSDHTFMRFIMEYPKVAIAILLMAGSILGLFSSDAFKFIGNILAVIK